MRLFSLSAIVLVLALGHSVLCQQRLVVHNDRDDACGRFKIRILTPPDVDERILPAKSFAGGIDSRMVWDPCREDRPQIVFGHLAPGPGMKDSGMPVPPLPVRGSFLEPIKTGPSEIPLFQPRFTFQLKLRQP